MRRDDEFFIGLLVAKNTKAVSRCLSAGGDTIETYASQVNTHIVRKNWVELAEIVLSNERFRPNAHFFWWVVLKIQRARSTSALGDGNAVPTTHNNCRLVKLLQANLAKYSDSDILQMIGCEKL